MEYEKEKKEVNKKFIEKVRDVLGKIPFVPDAVTLYYCALDTKTPITVKIIAYSALAYFILPFDVIPDVAIGVGYLDDAAAIGAAITALQPYITDEHRAKANLWLNCN